MIRGVERVALEGSLTISDERDVTHLPLPRPALREYSRDMRGVLGTARYWLPFVGGILSMIAVQYVGAILGWILIIAGFGLIIEGATKLWEKAGSTGNLTTYKQ